MTCIRLLPAFLMMLLILIPVSGTAQTPIGWAFTYQGSLLDGVDPADGLYDLRFRLFDADAGGSQLGGDILMDDVLIADGVFSVKLDFGSTWFDDTALWLQIDVRGGAETGPFTIVGRQELTPTPFAMSLCLPFYEVSSDPGYLFQMTNGDGGAGRFRTNGNSQPGLRVENNSSGAGATAIEAEAPFGYATGIRARGTGRAGHFEGLNSGSNGIEVYAENYAIFAENPGTGTGIYVQSNGSYRTDPTIRAVNNQPNAGMVAYFTNNSTWATAHLQNDGTGEVLWLDNNGQGHYIVAASPTGNKFWVDQTGTTHTKVLEILGGADLSEQFDVAAPSGELRPGMVVSIDPTLEGRLTVSRTAYDRRVAGILSGAGGVNPGMIMGQEGSAADGDHSVALTGRVYCWVDASCGSIEPGDLLTTSDNPGHAMKALDPVRAQGAILGKAMGSLAEGTGLILVLVGLQ